MGRVEPRPFDFEHPHQGEALNPAIARHSNGLRFIATMQPRTPLYVLLRHGEVRDPRDLPPPDFPFWAGIWGINPKSLDELFGTTTIDAKLAATSKAATHIGPQLVEDYLPFLIAFRQIIESDLDDEAAMQKIDDMRLHNRWGDFIESHGGARVLLEHSGEPRRPAE